MAHSFRIASNTDGTGLAVHYKETFDEEHQWFPRPAPTVASSIYKHIFSHPDERQGFPMNPIEVTYLQDRSEIYTMLLIVN